MHTVMENILNQFVAYIYISDIETDELLFINKNAREALGIDYDISGRRCWEVIQSGMTGRCPFCPVDQLQKDPDRPVEWEEQNTATHRYYKNADSVIEWTDGRKVHIQYSLDITDAKLTQLEAEKTRGVLENILNGMDAYVYVSDMATDEILFINKKMREAFGLGEDVIGEICWKVLQKGFTGRCSFCPIKRLETDPGTPVVWEECNTVTGRQLRNVDSVIEWTDGKKVHLQVYNDVTDILEAQKEASQIKERLQLALTASQTGVWELDLNTNVLTYDELCGKLFNFKSETGALDLDTLVAHTNLTMLSATGPDVYQGLRDKNLYDEVPYRDFTLRMDDGGIRYVRSYGSTKMDDAGNPQRLVGMCMDITQSVLLERELKAAKVAAEKAWRDEAEERTQIMLDSTPLMASFWDPDGNMLDCNMESLRVFGLSDKTEYIEHFHDLNPEYQPDGEPTAVKAAREIAAAFETGYRRFEWMYKKPNGEPLPVETTLVRVLLRDEPRLAAYSRDLREIRAMEQEWRKAEQHSLEMELRAKVAFAESEAKSQFLSNISHEIRTPMNAVLGMAELLSYEGLSKRQAAYVSDIKTSATSLLGIINDILDYSKIGTGKFQLAPVHFNFMEMLDNLRSMFEFASLSKGIVFKMHIKGEAPACLYGDDIRLRQILVNILGNAVKFTREGEVVFTVEAGDGFLDFDIADTGIGMKKEEIPFAFQEFAQLDRKSNRNISGTGLGLAITKQLVDLMGASIRVESEYGVGTVFHVRVPLVPGDPDKVEGDGDGHKHVCAPMADVLVVDDNELNLNVASGLLLLSGITCDTALSGREAIEMVKEKKYDLVFMDHMMPDMDGVETTRILRRTYNEKELVIVALTANAVRGARETLIRARMNDYLSKPIDRTQLNRVLLEWLPAEKIEYKTEDAFAPGGELSPLLQQVEEIEGIDLRLGLDRIGGLQDAYETSLGIFVRTLPDAGVRLLSFLDVDDLKAFSIEVHGLKGSLNNLGASDAAYKAEELEKAANDGRSGFCMEKLPDLLATLDYLYEKLSDMLARNTPEEVFLGTGDKDSLAGRLASVRELLYAFESDAALAMLRDIRKDDYGEPLNGRLAEIARHIDEFDYERAIAAIDSV